MSAGSKFSIALVGGGNMGSALLAGWLADGIDAASITIVDPSPPDSLLELVKKSGAKHLHEAPGGPAPDVLLLAVKPQIINGVMESVRHLCGARTVVVSIAAGIGLARLHGGFDNRPAAVRAMPNTPALVGRGITVACASPGTSQAQRRRVDRLLSAVGSLEWIDDESLLDAVTAVSGSGPAYVFYLAECMAAAGVAEGLPPDLAARLANETVAGAGELIHRSQDDPARLRGNVTSPGGTTAAALDILTRADGLESIMKRAIRAARQRARELSG